MGFGSSMVIIWLLVYVAAIVFLFVMIYRFVKAHEHMSKSMERIASLLKNKKLSDKE